MYVLTLGARQMVLFLLSLPLNPPKDDPFGPGAMVIHQLLQRIAHEAGGRLRVELPAGQRLFELLGVDGATTIGVQHAEELAEVGLAS